LLRVGTARVAVIVVVASGSGWLVVGTAVQVGGGVTGEASGVRVCGKAPREAVGAGWVVDRVGMVGESVGRLCTELGMLQAGKRKTIRQAMRVVRRARCAWISKRVKEGIESMTYSAYAGNRQHYHP
jgi:hypothetical protein